MLDMRILTSVWPIDHRNSYISQLEQRLLDIESSLQQLHSGQNDGRITLSSREDHDTPANESLSTVEEHRSVFLPSTLGSHDATELGEIDISENSIDGMGALKFTNEEDCGFFGMPHNANSSEEEGREENISAANSCKVLRQILRLCATYLELYCKPNQETN